MANYGGYYFTDQEIVQLSTDKLVSLYAGPEFPWLTIPEIGDSTGDIFHHWTDDPEGLVSTMLNMSGGMTGGSTTETITVDDTTAYIAGNRIVFQQNTVAAQMARITSITNSTEMVVAAMSGNLLAHDDNTTISLAGDYVKYGDSVLQPLGLPTRVTNAIEQVSVVSDIPANVAKARGLAGDSLEAYLTRRATMEFKQKLSMSSLFGVKIDADATSGYGNMNGVVNLIPSANKSTSTTWGKPAFRSFITALKKRTAFPAKAGIMLVNAQMVDKLYSLDDASTGISQRDTDKPIEQLVVAGVTFKIVEEMCLNNYFPSTKEAAIILTPMAGGRPLIKIARCAIEGEGKPRDVLKQQLKYQLQVAEFATVQLKDSYRHGVWVSS